MVGFVQLVADDRTRDSRLTIPSLPPTSTLTTVSEFVFALPASPAPFSNLEIRCWSKPVGYWRRRFDHRQPPVLWPLISTGDKRLVTVRASEIHLRVIKVRRHLMIDKKCSSARHPWRLRCCHTRALQRSMQESFEILSAVDESQCCLHVTVQVQIYLGGCDLHRENNPFR